MAKLEMLGVVLGSASGEEKSYYVRICFKEKLEILPDFNFDIFPQLTQNYTWHKHYPVFVLIIFLIVTPSKVKAVFQIGTNLP